MQPGDQSRSGILKGTIDKLPKVYKRFDKLSYKYNALLTSLNLSQGTNADCSHHNG